MIKKSNSTPAGSTAYVATRPKEKEAKTKVLKLANLKNRLTAKARQEIEALRKKARSRALLIVREPPLKI